ncbi:MAG: FimB/Mfa2 family fimbrial subunit [Tannerellaceae bacterium]|nr:FimB/Mfa2 family fimbrial subunit [Tannerellaceae bacterium]
MILNKIMEISPRLFSLLLIAVTATGCMKEKYTDCFEEPAGRLVTVSAYAGTGEELPAGILTSVHLYYFDEQEIFFSSIQTEPGERALLPDEAYHIIAWGNLGGNVEIHSGESLREFTLSLKGETRAAYYAQPPGDIFHGMITLEDIPEETTEVVIPIYRKAGSLTVTIKGLQAYTGFTDGFSVVVGETLSRIAFDGTLGGEKVSYRPEGGFTDAADTWYVAPFSLIPGEGVAIDIYHDTSLVASIEAQSSGEAITVREGELTNVLIDMTHWQGGSGNLRVSVALTPWGTEAAWKDF